MRLALHAKQCLADGATVLQSRNMGQGDEMGGVGMQYDAVLWPDFDQFLLDRDVGGQLRSGLWIAPDTNHVLPAVQNVEQPRAAFELGIHLARACAGRGDQQVAAAQLWGDQWQTLRLPGAQLFHPGRQPVETDRDIAGTRLRPSLLGQPGGDLH